MFKQTRFRLALLFSVVFFVLINGLGAILYFTTEQRLYVQTDRAIENEMRGFAFISGRSTERPFPIRPKHLMTFIQWDLDGKLVQQVPRDESDQQVAQHMRRAGVKNQFVNVTIGDTSYRVLTKKVPTGTLQIAYNLEPERNVLDNLLFIIGTGSLVSIVIAMITGYFLASRALVPIRQAWEQQQRFVSDASHELRTPLSVLRIQLERLFRHPERTIEEESGKISVMIDETKRMSKLVGDLLTLARSDANHIQFYQEPVLLKETILQAVRQLEEVCRLRGIRLEIDLSDVPPISADRNSVVQLLLIVLDNAVNYTREEGVITVRCRHEGHAAIVEIEDTGIGIASKDLPFIFDRFYRADKARSRSDGGTGLGLSIAKWIIDSHHGSIQAKSEQGKGTTIQIQFPYEQQVQRWGKR